jgi:hypothetical protein
MFATFILVLFYRYDRVTTSLWIRYPRILLGDGLQLAYVCLQIILWLRNANTSHLRVLPSHVWVQVAFGCLIPTLGV